MSETRLEISGVGKDFGYQHVLHDVSLTVEEGEFVALMGPNGTGKTTLLRMAAGLTRPTSGQIKVAGVDLTKAGPGLRRRIGFVSHESLLYPDLTGRENLEFHARLFGVDSVDEAIADLSELLDLERILDRPAGVLSRGNRQRLTLARALLHAPRILLLDEPFTGLDEESTRRLLSILQQLVAAGRTVIMTTHDRAIVEAGPKRLVVLGGGSVVEDRPVVSSAATSAVDKTPSFLQPTLVRPPARAKAAWAVAAKDLKVEARTRDVLGSGGLFALSVLVTSSFTMPPGETSSGMATGVLWISILFATVLGVGRTMAREAADRGIEGLLLSPVPRDAVYLGKVLGSLILMGIVDSFIVLMFVVMLASAAPFIQVGGLVATVLLGTAGLVAVATLFSGIAVGSRLGETMLPLLVMPISLPLMIGAVELTRQTLGAQTAMLWQWLGVLGGYCLMVGLVGIATFTYVIEE